MNIENIIELLYQPLDSEVVVDFLQYLDLEIPVVDENYIVEGEVYTEESKLGLSFTFKEIGGEVSASGIPQLSQVFIHESYQSHLPFDIKRSDSYECVKKKIGAPAIYGHKYVKSMRAWKLQREDNKPYAMSIRFNKSLEEILGFSVYSLPKKSESKKFILKTEDQ